jgi:hypothetical protein
MIVEDSFIHDNGYTGIYLDGFGSLTVDNSEIYNNGIGSSATAGMYLKDVSSVTVTRSQIHDNQMAGIAVQGTSNVTIGADLVEADPFAYGNDIYGNIRAGVQVGGQLATPLNGNLIIRGNYLHNNGAGSYGAGIWLRAAVLSATISQNDIAQNRLGGIGIQKAPTSVNTSLVIEKNNIHDNILRGGIHTGNTTGAFANPGNFTADSTIKQNKVHDNSNVNNGGGIDVRHFRGTIKNNLVYGNSRGGIRYGDYVTEISNNTVANNGNDTNDRGGGIIYDDPTDNDFVNDPPTGVPPAPLLIRNNISVYNQKTGIRGCFDNTPGSEERDYNLVYFNNGTTDDCGWYTSVGVSYVDDLRCANKNYGGCGAHVPRPLAMDNPHDIIAVPLFFNIDGDDYHLDTGSPAIDAGDPDPAYDDTDESINDMGAYGGPEPFDDSAFPLPYVNCLIDGDTNTGNTLSSGRFLYFDLGSSYTVQHVRLYGSPTTYPWNVNVSDTSDGCAAGTQVLSWWSVGGDSQWYVGDVTVVTAGRYIQIVRQDWTDMPSNAIFEFQFTDVASPGEGDWRTPVAVVKDCTSIYGLCKQ